MGAVAGNLVSPEKVLSYRESLKQLREILFANIVMAGEIPAPTGGEAGLTRFLSDRFTEGDLHNISTDSAGNVAAVLCGREGRRNLLVAAHTDKIWEATDDHTVSVGVGRMSGRGLADNALGVAVLATLPLILETLEIELDSNVILLGTTRSFGRGDLRGMRFFLENTDLPISSGLCLEGIDLGRLSFSSLGMARGEITVETHLEAEGPDECAAGAIPILTELLSDILDINRREYPKTTILVGAVEAGSGYNVPPRTGSVRFEIRSRVAANVERIEKEVVERVESLNGGCGFASKVEIIAKRKPGDLGKNHPLVWAARKTLSALRVEARVEPSISELAPLLDRRIPALTLGITRGEHRHTPDETIHLEPIFDGLAQLAGMLQFMDTVELPA